jgi:hypothetical protein
VNALRNDAPLAAAVDGRVHLEALPAGSQLPAVVVSQYSSRDVNTIGGQRVLAVVQLLVKVIGRAQELPTLASIADRVDTVLQGASAELVSVTVHGCVRSEQVFYLEEVQAGGYAHIGGIYQVIVRERR